MTYYSVVGEKMVIYGVISWVDRTICCVDRNSYTGGSTYAHILYSVTPTPSRQIFINILNLYNDYTFPLLIFIQVVHLAKYSKK